MLVFGTKPILYSCVAWQLLLDNGAKHIVHRGFWRPSTHRKNVWYLHIFTVFRVRLLFMHSARAYFEFVDPENTKFLFQSFKQIRAYQYSLCSVNTICLQADSLWVFRRSWDAKCASTFSNTENQCLQHAALATDLETEDFQKERRATTGEAFNATSQSWGIVILKIQPERVNVSARFCAFAVRNISKIRRYPV